LKRFKGDDKNKEIPKLLAASLFNYGINLEVSKSTVMNIVKTLTGFEQKYKLQPDSPDVEFKRTTSSCISRFRQNNQDGLQFLKHARVEDLQMTTLDEFRVPQVLANLLRYFQNLVKTKGLTISDIFKKIPSSERSKKLAYFMLFCDYNCLKFIKQEKKEFSLKDMAEPQKKV
jgi:hypothetical protein